MANNLAAQSTGAMGAERFMAAAPTGQEPQAGAATGAQRHAGSAATQQAAQATSGTGAGRFAGDASTSQAAQVVAASVVERFAAAAVTAQEVQETAGTGGGQAIAGTADTTQPPGASAGVGRVPVARRRGSGGVWSPPEFEAPARAVPVSGFAYYSQAEQLMAAAGEVAHAIIAGTGVTSQEGQEARGRAHTRIAAKVLTLAPVQAARGSGTQVSADDGLDDEAEFLLVELLAA